MITTLKHVIIEVRQASLPHLQALASPQNKYHFYANTSSNYHAKFSINTHLKNPFRYFTTQLNQAIDWCLWNTNFYQPQVHL